jgi:hypothetical protein
VQIVRPPRHAPQVQSSSHRHKLAPLSLRKEITLRGQSNVAADIFRVTKAGKLRWLGQVCGTQELDPCRVFLEQRQRGSEEYGCEELERDVAAPRGVEGGLG